MTSHERSEADTAPPARKENPSRSLLAPKVQPEDPSTGPSGRSLGGGVFLHEGGMRNIKESAFETGGAKFTMVYDELIVTHGFTLLDAFVWSLFHRMEGWEDGCIASQGYISKRAGVGRSTVQRCVQRLIDTGWIISEERYSGETRLPNRYKTMLPANPMIQNEQGGCSQNEAVKRVPIQRVPTEEVEDTTLRMEGGVVGGETHKDLQLHPSNEENSQRLTRAWRLAHKMGAEEDPSAPL